MKPSRSHLHSQEIPEKIIVIFGRWRQSCLTKSNVLTGPLARVSYQPKSNKNLKTVIPFQLLMNLAKIYVAGMLVTEAVGSTALLSLNVVSYGPSQRCRTVVDPEREQWKISCRGRNSELIDDSVLPQIYQRRKDTLLENKCNPGLEQWYCERNHQLGGEYREIFFKRFGISEQK